MTYEDWKKYSTELQRSTEDDADWCLDVPLFDKMTYIASRGRFTSFRLLYESTSSPGDIVVGKPVAWALCGTQGYPQDVLRTAMYRDSEESYLLAQKLCSELYAIINPKKRVLVAKVL